MITTIDDKIRVKTLEISVEKDNVRKAELNKQLTKLKLRKELENLN